MSATIDTPEWIGGTVLRGGEHLLDKAAERTSLRLLSAAPLGANLLHVSYQVE